MEQGFKVSGKQPFELFRSPVHGLSNARKGLGCTDELGLVETPKGGPALFHQPARPDLIPLTAWVRACGAGSSPEMNLVLRKLCSLFVLLPSPLSQRAVEVSVANRNGALGEGGISFNYCRRYAPVRGWPTSRRCGAAECYTGRFRAPSLAGRASRFQNAHRANIPVSRSR